MSQSLATKSLIWAALVGLVVLAGVLTHGDEKRHALVASQAGETSTRAPSTTTTAATGDRFKIPVTDSQPAKGNPEALVTLIEWNDLRCATCAKLEPVVDQLLQIYGKELRVVWRNDPKIENVDSLVAAEFAMEAHTQSGKFWEAKALLAAHPQRLNQDILFGFAKQLGLDERGLKLSFDQHSHGAHLAADGVFAKSFGVTELPAFFVNGVRVPAPLTLEHLRAAIDDELPRAQQLLAHGVPAQDVYAELTKNGLWKLRDPQASGL